MGTQEGEIIAREDIRGSWEPASESGRYNGKKKPQAQKASLSYRVAGVATILGCRSGRKGVESQEF